MSLEQFLDPGLGSDPNLLLSLFLATLQLLLDELLFHYRVEGAVPLGMIVHGVAEGENLATTVFAVDSSPL